MKKHLNLLIIMVLSCITLHGAPCLDVDTSLFQTKMTELSNAIKDASAFNESPDRVGSWAMPTLVALRYGLVVNDTIDERYDDEASTRAATSYLRDLYTEFGNWELCYCAYLLSPAYVRNFQARHCDSIPKPQPVVKKEKAKVPQNVKLPKPKQESKYITYIVKSGDTLGKIAKKHHVTVADLKKWNNLKSDFIRENQKLKIKQ